MLWCCVEPARVDKTTPIMEAMAQGFGGKVCLGAPPDDGEMFAVWGQQWLALELIPTALKSGRPFLQIDNGFVRPACGTLIGYYRISYCSLSPVLLANAPPSRIMVAMAPWRENGRHVILALPGSGFGRAIGLDMGVWIQRSQTILRRATGRPIIVRPKKSGRTMDADMRHCWALVTHSSNVAVDAVLMGIPVFVAPTCPAAPVGNLDLAKMETPDMPDRSHWFDSLMAQQFTVDEMRSGLAKDYLQMVIDRKIAA
jgi:hypothetical protein